ncbi:hypothetical protein [Chitinophaga polysaccharea]|nr:hypothetical protein [Chitinophaga polysaccharea]
MRLKLEVEMTRREIAELKRLCRYLLYILSVIAALLYNSQILQ